jgi:hypothetical protein
MQRAEMESGLGLLPAQCFRSDNGSSERRPLELRGPLNGNTKNIRVTVLTSTPLSPWV